MSSPRNSCFILAAGINKFTPHIQCVHQRTFLMKNGQSVPLVFSCGHLESTPEHQMRWVLYLI